MGEAVAVTNKSRYRNRNWPCPKCGVGLGQVCRYPSNYHYVKGQARGSRWSVGRSHVGTDTAKPIRRIRRGCSGRPCRRPASSGPGIRSHGWARRSGPCSGPSPPLWPLKNSQSERPAALAIAFTRRAIYDSDSPNTSSSLAWRWGLASCRPRPFKEARTPWSRPGDSWPANSWTLAMALVARRMVAMLAP